MLKIPNNFSIEALTDEEIQLIVCWVGNNGPEN
jgi:hypothetical protein